MEPESCWHCGHPSAASLFCKYCNTLQQPTPDYFEFFGLPRRLHVDRKALEQRFYQLSRLLHPDRYMHRTPTERQYSLEATAILNDAYRVLRDPVLRAEYLLKEQPTEPGKRPPNVAPELLEEVFELNLALEELRGGDGTVRQRIEEARWKFLGMRHDTDHELEKRFAKYDALPAPQVLNEVRALLGRRRFIQNLIQETEKELAP